VAFELLQWVVIYRKASKARLGFVKTVEKPLSLVVQIDACLEVDELFALRDEAQAWCEKARRGKDFVEGNSLNIIIEAESAHPDVAEAVKGALECVSMVNAKLDLVVTGPAGLRDLIGEDLAAKFKFFSNESIEETGSGLITRPDASQSVIFEGTGGAGDSIADATLFLERLVDGIRAKYNDVTETEGVALDLVDLAGAKDTAPAIRAMAKFQSSSVRGEIGLSFSEEAFRNVASAMLGRKVKELDEKLLDGAAELLNIFVSATKSDLNAQSYGFQLERPGVLSEFEMFKWMKESRPVKMTFSSGKKEQFYVYLRCEPQPKFNDLAVEVLRAA
jgi:hypothetical protein